MHKMNQEENHDRAIGGALKHLLNIALLGMLTSACGYDGPSMDVTMLKRKLDTDVHSIVVVDVRPRSLFDKGHIETAMNIPLEQFDAFKQEIARYNKPIAIICTCGRRSLEAIRKLQDIGLSARLVVGGMNEWEKAGYPTVASK